MQLVKHCRDILAKAEHRLQQLHEREDGTLAVKDVEKKK